MRSSEEVEANFSRIEENSDMNVYFESDGGRQTVRSEQEKFETEKFTQSDSKEEQVGRDITETLKMIGKLKQSHHHGPQHVGSA